MATLEKSDSLILIVMNYLSVCLKLCVAWAYVSAMKPDMEISSRLI